MTNWESTVEETCRAAWSNISNEEIERILGCIREEIYEYIHNNMDEVVDLVLNKEGELPYLEHLIKNFHQG